MRKVRIPSHIFDRVPVHPVPQVLEDTQRIMEAGPTRWNRWNAAAGAWSYRGAVAIGRALYWVRVVWTPGTPMDANRAEVVRMGRAA